MTAWNVAGALVKPNDNTLKLVVAEGCRECRFGHILFTDPYFDDNHWPSPDY